MEKNFKRTKYTCYYTYLAMSSVFALTPILFLTFKEMYSVSYTLLGTLVFINFFTQLLIDLVFTFFAQHFNIRNTVKTMPLITSCGMLVYALVPTMFPQHAYVGLVVGTVIFSVSAGLCEVLLSPTVAALPSDTHEKDMSVLHSLYAYGFVTVVVVSTAFLKIFGRENWMYLTLFWACLPILSFVLFSVSPLPELKLSRGGKEKKNKYSMLMPFVMCIFLGSAAENVMTNWISGYVENVLHISKSLGDILGMAMFATLLGIARSAYAKYGKNISNVMLAGMIGAAVCYVVVAFSHSPAVSLTACVLTGFFTAMLWPGTLIMMDEKLYVGVAAYALMAAGGDFGASFAPQLMGVIVDTVAESGWAVSVAANIDFTPEQIGMKAGMLFSVIFPVLGAFVVIYIKNKFNGKEKLSQS